MAQGRSTAIILMIEWIRTSRLSIKISLSLILVESLPRLERVIPRFERRPPCLYTREQPHVLGLTLAGSGLSCWGVGTRMLIKHTELCPFSEFLEYSGYIGNIKTEKPHQRERTEWFSHLLAWERDENNGKP